MSGKLCAAGRCAPAVGVVVSIEDVKKLAEALAKAAAALREAERLLLAVAPVNAMKAEKLAQEYERAAEAIAKGEVA